MVIIRPFNATILNPALPDRENLVCPVYDTIDETQYARYASDDNSVIHITTRRAGADSSAFVQNAKKELDRLYNEGVLLELEHPALYIYGIRYRLAPDVLEQIPDSAKREVYFAFGLIALVKVEGPGEGSIVGHERIFEKHSTERYELMRTLGMNFSPIVSEYNMPGHDINNIFEEYLGFKRPDLKLRADRMPVVDLTLNNTRHLLWELRDPVIIQKIQDLMADEEVLILDGHHRYTATHRLSLNDGVDFTMMMFMEGGDRALLLLPWHRCIRQIDEAAMKAQLERHFELIWKGHRDDARLYELLNARDGAGDVRFGLYDGDGLSVYRAHRDEVDRLSKRLDEKTGLDYISLNEWIIGPCLDGNEVDAVSFCDSVTEAVRKVDEQGYRAAFLMRPLDIEEVEYKAHIEKKNFPQKSTLFLPKVAEGILMRRFRG